MPNRDSLVVLVYVNSIFNILRNVRMQFALSVLAISVARNKRRRLRAARLLRIAVKRSAQRLHRTIWVQARSGMFWEKDVLTFDDKRFKDSFRMTRKSFEGVVRAVAVLERQDTNFRKAIPLAKRVAIALYALGSSSEYRTLSNMFGVGRTTIEEIVLDFCAVIYEVWRSKYMSAYPMDRQKLQEIVQGFENLGYHQCVGAIDGTHIEVSPRKVDAIDYYNYKGWYSIILLASVDHRYRFTYINVGLTGRNNDSTAYENSALKKFAESNDIYAHNSKNLGGVMVPAHLIGDSAFKLSKYLLKPYPFAINQPPQEKMFNYYLSKSRLVVENAFGHLKKRFRRIGRGLEVRIDHASTIIKACCVLHNYLCEEKDPIPEHWTEVHTAGRVQPEFNSIATGEVEGRNIRDCIAQYIYQREDRRDILQMDPIEAVNLDSVEI